jgi:subtilisin family serine protease
MVSCGGRRVAVVVATVILAAGFFAGPARAGGDPFLEKQWGITTIGAPAAWARSTGAGVRIGIVDTGIDLAHEDLAGHIVESTSCLDTAGDPTRCAGSAQDDVGHGTHVAGIAAAVKDNGKGVAGVAPDATLVVAKVFKGDTAQAPDVIAGIKWVVDHGAKVVNLSLGGPFFIVTAAFGSDLTEGVEYAWAHGAVPVVASGNEGFFGSGIGSAEYGRMNSSPTGNAKWAVIAPGGSGGPSEADDIYSTIWKKGQPNAYGYLAGTSMAAPHVTSAVALLLGQGLTTEQTVERILTTTDPIPCGPNSDNCRGRLNVARAVGAPSR